MEATKARPVLLVGSVPLESSASVFEAVGTKLGNLAKRIPDGETGVRKDWIGWQAEVFKNAKGPNLAVHESFRAVTISSSTK